MCGIAGFCDENINDGFATITLMQKALNNRGPDGRGVFNFENYFFCHTRLSIIDLNERSNQPFQSNCGNYIIVFNGEIYNYKELRDKFSLNCRTLSDTEVVLELFIKMGPKHVEELNGMFAYSIFNLKTKNLYLFRDRIGVKPLFFSHIDHHFSFASEIKALRQIHTLNNRLTIDNAAIGDFLHLGYIPEPKTIFNEIKKFSAGSYAVFDGNKVEIFRYWDLQDKISKSVHHDERSIIENLELLLEHSIKYRLVSDVPLGVFLSGGVDSSLVTSLIRNQYSGPLKSFTIGFEDSKYDESNFAGQIANILGTDHHKLIVTENDFLKLFPQIFDIFDEPFADQSMFPSLMVSELARQHVKVVLTGDGGDEAFLGYGSYNWAKRLNMLRNRYFRNTVAAILKCGNSRYRRVGELLKYPDEYSKFSHIHSKENGYFSRFEIDLLNKNLNHRVDIEIDFKTSRLLHDVEKQSIHDTAVYLKDDLLVKVDRSSMWHSLEAREPLLDYHLLEYSHNIDLRVRHHSSTSKYLLKKILNKYLPTELIERPKWGFTIPLRKWLDSEISLLKNEFLNDKTVNEFGYFKWKDIQKLLNEESRYPYKTQQVWAMILLHKWLKEKH